MSEPTKRDLIFEDIRELLMSGTPRAAIAKYLTEKYDFQIRAAYKWITKFMKSDEFFKDRDDIRSEFKSSLYHMYLHSYTKGWTRSALEVMDRLMVICPWLKEAADQTEVAPIKIEIVEHRAKDDAVDGDE